ncbi:MAG TPA: type I-E CRISPR-associated endonuclease Cas1e [Longimicrobiales bacterium]
MLDLHMLPKVSDSLSHLYVEHCRIEQDAKAVALFDARGKIPIPCASLNLLMLGPGTSITHAAVRALAENGCMIVWCGEGGVRVYAASTGETRSGRNLIRQARAWADPESRLRVVRRLYEMRFDEPLDPELTLQQIRGLEGIRVRTAYSRASKESGVEWHGRSYRRGEWGATDAVNRALSAANSCLYGVCHAAIVATGYSPGLGFIHTGKMLSFVYDVADLYKTETTIPAAFRAAAEGTTGLEGRVRRAMRDMFVASRLLERIVADIDTALAGALPADLAADDDAFASDGALPGRLWDPETGEAAGGKNWADADPE